MIDKNLFHKNWDRIKEKVRTKWNKLTDEDLRHINGNFTELTAKLQKRYGYSKEQAEKELQSLSLPGMGEHSPKMEHGRSGHPAPFGEEKRHGLNERSEGEDEWKKKRKIG